MLTLAGWGICDSINSQNFSLPLLLVIMQFLVYFTLTAVGKRQVGDDRSNFGYIVALTVFLIVFEVLLAYGFGR